MVRRAIDLMGSLLGLVILAPVFAVCAVCVRLSSSGPVFFIQARLGHLGAPFPLLKFRTMYVGVPDLRNADGSACSCEGDLRVTPIGRFLRRSSLDELPQLINILLGEMSLVGPRPDQVDQLSFYSEYEKRKLLVKPGLTGLAQISGRNSIPWEKRKALDVEYVERQSVGLDLLILCQTVLYVLCRKDVNSRVAGT